MNHNRLKTLKLRLNKLKEPNNNFNVIDTLDDIRVRVSSLLVQHEKYNELKKRNTKNPLIPDVLDNLVYDYTTIIDSMDMYLEHPQIKTLQKSLIPNLKDLYRDQKLYFKKLGNNNVPGMGELKHRFANLTRYARTLRAKRTKKR
tara:strand:- start:564 stop:998 length:435 start_codon:yes stop_codon:yes gene_type:complete